jgi:hypothetical protein
MKEKENNEPYFTTNVIAAALSDAHLGVRAAFEDMDHSRGSRRGNRLGPRNDRLGELAGALLVLRLQGRTALVHCKGETCAPKLREEEEGIRRAEKY